MKLISVEAFDALNIEEQKNYLIEIIRNLPEDKARKLSIKMAQKGLIDEIDEKPKSNTPLQSNGA
jgi:hypothetical protein